MTIEEKFSSVPCDLLINTEASPYVWRFDPDCLHFFLEEKSEADDLSPYYVETPYRDTYSNLFCQIFWSMLDEDDVKHIKDNYEGSFDDHVTFTDFLENSKVGGKLYWAKKKYPMYLLDSWERHHEFCIDWDCVTYG